nr:MAG TPA: hypothetical protein [Caudoviricetes sp.]
MRIRNNPRRHTSNNLHQRKHLETTMNRTTATISIIISALIALSGITLVYETVHDQINSINLPIGFFLILIGVTAGLSVWNEYIEQKDIQCVKNSTRLKTLSNDSTNSNNTLTNSNNSSNSEQ